MIDNNNIYFPYGTHKQFEVLMPLDQGNCGDKIKIG